MAESGKDQRLEYIFKYIDMGKLTDGQERLIISFEDQYRRKGYLSSRQEEVLEDIFRRSNEL
jgi:hypothetical protein